MDIGTVQEARGAEWDDLRRQVLQRDGLRCVDCQRDLGRDGAHVHHLLPRSSGGTDEPANLVSLCPMCHAAVHPNLSIGLARGLLQRSAVRLAQWFDSEGWIARQTLHLGPALKLFGLTAFRREQLDVVGAALRGESLLMVSPTGSGKSLAFQVPAVLTPGLCVIVSPLRALMSDQVSALLRHRIPATFLNADLSAEERRSRLELLERGFFKFLYLAPERFFGRNAAEMSVLRRLRPSYLIIDEAHCIDRWGDDFRPEYGRLGEVRAQLGNPPVLAFTATAGVEAQKRILGSLGAASAAAFVHGVNRPNISLLRHRVPQAGRAEFIAGLLHRVAVPGDVKTMVFVPTVKIGETLLRSLQQAGIDTAFYHGQLPPVEKQAMLQRFAGHSEPRLQTIICTNAFGMGVDIRDIRMVIHWQHPASPEDYLQEIGRAGRTGQRSIAILLTDERPNSQAFGLLEFMVMKTLEGADQAGRGERQAQKLRVLGEMQRFAFAKGCFRQELLAYFGPAPNRAGRSIARRLIEWAFTKRRAAPEQGICCDVCHRRSRRRRGVVDPQQFACEALGLPTR